MSKLLDIDPLTGQKKIFHYDQTNDQVTIETQQDVTDILNETKGQYAAESSKGRNWQGDMHKVASIPMSVYAELMKNGIAKDQRKLRKWLNDPDNKYFRTKGGYV